MAGTTTPLFFFHNETENWIIDSGATDHMTSRLSSLDTPIDMKSSPHTYVGLPNGTKTRIQHTGFVKLDETISLDHVLQIPDFKYNLFSISKFTSSNNCAIIFYPDFCLIQDLWNGKLKGIGRKCQGLYFYVHFTQSIAQNSIDVHALAKNTLHN